MKKKNEKTDQEFVVDRLHHDLFRRVLADVEPVINNFLLA